MCNPFSGHSPLVTRYSLLATRMPDPPLLSIALLARDEIGHLGACLESVAAWSASPTGELVIVLDDRAPEEMEALARQHTPHVSRSRFVNFSAQRNRAL